VRKIIHLDMDAFYAAIEQRDTPHLRGRPVAVGSPQGRGVVLTASYEARVYGVRSAMPSLRARRLCPDLVFVPPRFDAYREVSRRIREIFARFAALVEPLSLDEAYLDVTEPLTGPMPAVRVARAIKAAIRDETGLTGSAGVSFNKFLAKLASDLNKPDGLSVILPEDACAFIAGLPVERFHGVGPATAARMHAMGIRTGADLQRMDSETLVSAFGRAGLHYWKIAHARDDRPVDPDRPRLSVSVEDTFATDVEDLDRLAAVLGDIASRLAERLLRAGFVGRTLTLKIKYADFTIRTRRRTALEPWLDALAIRRGGEELLTAQPGLAGRVRLLGLGVGNPVEDDGRQLELFG
jgi:DNA polymerase-4